MLRADLLRGLGAFARLCRRHAHVDDRDVRLPAANGLVQLACVAGLSDALETAFGGTARQSLGREPGVPGDREPHGISPTPRVPLPGSLPMRRWPPCASTRSIRPRRPEPPSALAPPTPSSVTSTKRVESRWRA